MQREAQASRRAQKLADELSQLISAPSRRDAAERLALLLSQAGAQRVLAYLPADEGSRQLVCLATIGSAEHSPTFCEDFELLNYAQAENLQVVRLTLERKTAALLLLGASIAQPLTPLLDSLSIIGPQIAMTLALVMEREQTSRGAMKDPSSSAYTFAYFVDIAGREIDKARRHARRFALATLSIEPLQPNPNSLLRNPAIEVSESVLLAFVTRMSWLASTIVNSTYCYPRPAVLALTLVGVASYNNCSGPAVFATRVTQNSTPQWALLPFLKMVRIYPNYSASLALVLTLVVLLPFAASDSTVFLCLKFSTPYCGDSVKSASDLGQVPHKSSNSH